jgi:formylglycine-generating enzyme required for sulfatase activity
MRFSLIPAGTFWMGSPEDEEGSVEDEGPWHEVEITRPSSLGIYAVTQGEYARIMGANPSHFKLGDRHPVENVSWEDAVEFCQKLRALGEEESAGRAYRLPSEAEWEYACRGPAISYQPFNLGSSLSATQVNFDGNFPYGGAPEGVYRERTVPVDEFAPNGWGLYQMHGNVWEWCSDWFDPEYYAKSPKQDPQGALGGSRRVRRGGSWGSRGRYCRSAYRGGDGPADRDCELGFRVALVSSS